MQKIAMVISLVLIFDISLLYAKDGYKQPESISTVEDDHKQPESISAVEEVPERDISSAQDAIDALRDHGMIIPKEKIAAPDFALKNLNGDVIKLSDYRGKVVMLNFWATWCHPCIEEMPSKELLYKDLASEDFTIIAVNIQEDPDTVNKFITENEYSFPVVLDESGAITYHQYGTRAFPTTYIIDPDGNVVASIRGGHMYDGEIYRKIFRNLM